MQSSLLSGIPSKSVSGHPLKDQIPGTSLHSSTLSETLSKSLSFTFVYRIGKRTPAKNSGPLICPLAKSNLKSVTPKVSGPNLVAIPALNPV